MRLFFKCVGLCMLVSMFVVLIQHMLSSTHGCLPLCVCVYTVPYVGVFEGETQLKAVCVCAPELAECICKGNVKCHLKLGGIDWNSAVSMEKHVAVGHY